MATNNTDAIGENIKRVRCAIAEASQSSGRDPASIKLVAAAKTRPSSCVVQAIAHGVDAVGENRVQEMLFKKAEDAYRGAPLHFIGHLQSNKVRNVVGVCDLIESVDSLGLIELIGRRAVSLGIVQDVLIEVNVGREIQKAGVLPERTEEILHHASLTDGVNVLGLMAVPPILQDNYTDCHCFETMFQLFVDMSTKKYDNVAMRYLSMGMSGCYAEAIRAGSNVVRIGSAIFGER